MFILFIFLFIDLQVGSQLLSGVITDLVREVLLYKMWASSVELELKWACRASAVYIVPQDLLLAFLMDHLFDAEASGKRRGSLQSTEVQHCLQRSFPSSFQQASLTLIL